MLEKNKQYTVKISSLGYEGEGVAKVDSYPIFIPGALPSETVNVEIIKNKKNYANGELVNILEESEDRVNPKCKYYNKCGGCVLMHINYESQKDFKYNRVKDCIKRIGNISRDVVKKTIGMENEYRYRNKGILSVGYVNNKLSIGFLSEKTHEIVDIDDCLIQNEETMEIINIIKKWMNKYSIKAARNEGVFDNSGLIRNIMIRKTFKTNEIMVVLITTNKKIPYREELINELKEGFENIKGIVQNINSQNNNLILGHECITLWGQDYISDYIGEYKFNISPLSFFQVNPVQTEVLYSKALEYANLTGNEVVFDAYCGTGTITLFLSKKAKKVYGVEIVEQAIKNATINAKNNKIINTEFHVGKSEEVIPRLIKQGIKPDVIVVDPPRKGCDVKLLDAIGNAKPKKIVYVSCDPSTLARDLKYLETLGYDTVEVQPVDMFPNTKHVETVALLTKK